MILALLAAMRANAEASIRMIDAMIAATVEATNGGPGASDTAAGCDHPSEARVPIPSMGNPQQFRCGRCGAIGGQQAAQEGA